MAEPSDAFTDEDRETADRKLFLKAERDKIVRPKRYSWTDLDDL